MKPRALILISYIFGFLVCWIFPRVQVFDNGTYSENLTIVVRLAVLLSGYFLLSDNIKAKYP
jgi:multisubunit Na+/H+ antiporter MnhE subunit